MQKTICDRCNKEIEGKAERKNNQDLCTKCSEAFDKFMQGSKERKGFL